MKLNELTGQVIGAAIEVHKELGPGKSEAAYEAALSRELSLRKTAHVVQKLIPLVYKGVKLDCGYRLDLLVADRVVIEVKAAEAILAVHRAQVLTYLKLGGWRLALLLNFNVAALKQGIERFILGYDEDLGPLPAELPRQGIEVPRRVQAGLYSASDSCDPATEFFAKEIIASASEVHRELGPGLLSSAYEECLCRELHLRGVPFERHRSLPLVYKESPLPGPDQIQLLVGERVVVSARALQSYQPVHEAQLLSQVRLGGWRLGLLLNFNTVVLAEGIHRLVNSVGEKALRGPD